MGRTVCASKEKFSSIKLSEDYNAELPGMNGFRGSRTVDGWNGANITTNQLVRQFLITSICLLSSMVVGHQMLNTILQYCWLFVS